eukprot:g9386.t1
MIRNSGPWRCAVLPADSDGEAEPSRAAETEPVSQGFGDGNVGRTEAEHLNDNVSVTSTCSPSHPSPALDSQSTIGSKAGVFDQGFKKYDGPAGPFAAEFDLANQLNIFPLTEEQYKEHFASAKPIHVPEKPQYSSNWERAVAYHHGLYMPEKCTTPKSADDIRLAVADFSAKVGLGGLTVAPQGVHVAGSFQDWNPSSTALEDADMDGTFEITLDLAAGRHEFKFINGNSFEEAETVPEACSELDSNNFNRYISVATDGLPQEVHVCFGACSPCGELPACEEFNCPAGFALNMATLKSAGSSLATCCEDLTGSALHGVAVRSAGCCCQTAPQWY